jgi:hypothetical protein
VRALGAWRLIGVNALLFGSGLAEEEQHWDWLATALAGVHAAHPIALFIHKPPFVLRPDEPGAASATIPAASRARFWNLVRRHGVKLVACGHRHEHRTQLRDAVTVVWAPTTSALLDERTPPLGDADYAPGLVEYLLCGETLIHRFVRLGAPQEAGR